MKRSMDETVGSICGYPGTPAVTVPTLLGMMAPSHHSHHAVLSCKGKTTWLGVPKILQPSILPGQEPKAELARLESLSFCDLPLEGTSCSSQQGNKRSRLAPDLPGETGNWWEVRMLLPQLQTCHQSKGDAPGTFSPTKSTPRTTDGAQCDAGLTSTWSWLIPLLKAALPSSMPAFWGWDRLNLVTSLI